MKLFIASLILFLQIFPLHIHAQQSPKYSVYLIGDSGDPKLESDPVFTNLEKRLMKEGKNAAIIFLGDNIYHNGLPPKDREEEAENRIEAEKKLLVQLEAIDDFKGSIYFIPGNHDWNNAHADGLDYIQAQEEFVEFFLDRGDVLIPDHGCPGPEKKKLGKGIVLIAMDSQWWVHPHTDEQQEFSTCKNKNFDDIMQELKEMLVEHENDQVIIALHHPIYSDGGHNGYYTLTDHLFPFRDLNEDWWIPLPVLGSLQAFYRTTFGARQDMPHPLYQNLIEEMSELLVGQKNVILASGHEHNLQYFYKKENHFIKSGSGSKSSPLPKKTEALFSDDSKGYAKLEYYESGEVRLKYYTIEEENEIEKFNEPIIAPSLEFGKSGDIYEIENKEVYLKASDKYEKGGFHRFFFGNLYREDWSTPVSFPLLNLTTELDGLTPKKLGGGMSSRSIRLEGKNNKEYVLRSIEKGVSKVVPELFKNSIVQDIFQDQIAASQPYAALVVPPLADAVDVYHTNPKIVYLPQQPLLGDYNEEYGNQLYLYEERPAGNQSDVADLGNSRKIISYSKMLENVRSSSKYHIHQDQVLKSRLLDIYLGDWDRHDDQWRWAEFRESDHKGEDETHTFYEPIPRDRDQVMFRYQGFVPWISKLLSPELRKFQTFGPDIKNLKYLAYNARHFDRSYLNHLDKEDWIRISDVFTSKLTDDVIQNAVHVLPDPILKIREVEYENAFMARREKLKSWAMEHYLYLSKYVDVVGTRKNELFQAARNQDGSLNVKVYQKKKNGEIDDLLYERSFDPSETKEVRLYGLSGEDSFEINGTSSKGSLIRVIGGKGNDNLVDNSTLSGLRKSLFVYDRSSDNGMEPGPDGKDKRSDSYKVNEYDRKEYYYNSSIGIPFIGFNPDDGLVLSYSHAWSHYGFRKSPYKSKHNIAFSIASNTSQLSLDYSGNFVDIFGNTDLNFESFLYLPDNVSNFFGLTNSDEFPLTDFEDFDLFRYDRTDLKIKPSLSWSTARQISTIKVGPYFRYISIGDNGDKFINNAESSGLTQENFIRANYIGIEGEYQLLKINNKAFPTSGIDFTFSPSYNINVSNSSENFTQLEGSLTLYNYLWIPKPFVLASKIEGGINFGDFNFYQAQYIGLDRGLRGFRNNRFGGKSALVFSNDLRVRLGSTKGAFPLTIGLMAAYDYGRVWNRGETNTGWHKSYGGGFFISPFDVMPISFYYMKNSADSNLFLIKFGFAI